MTKHKHSIVISLFASSLLLLGLISGCGGDGNGSPDDGSAGAGGSAGSGGGSGGGDGDPSAAELIPKDGSPYLVASIAGKAYLLNYELSGARSPDDTSGLRGSRGIVLPLRDLELRMPTKIGTATCENDVMAKTSIVLRTNDLGTLWSVPEGAGCTIEVTQISEGRDQRMKGTFSGVVKDTTGTTVEITDGAFDVPTVN